MSPLLKYSLMQLPGIALAAGIVWAVWSWAGLPDWMAWGALGAWIAKDVAVYPLVRRSLVDGADRVGAGRLIGERGVAHEEIAPTGYVRVRGELWRARSSAPVAAGAAVRVRGVRRLTLLVEPD